MKYIILLLVCGMVTACNSRNDASSSAFGKNNNDSIRAAMSDTTNYTTLEWLDSVHQDLGKVSEGQVVEITWKFRNTGNKPLIVERVQPGCGCTVAEKPEQPIAPGKDGIIKAKFDSKGHPNMQNKDIYVYANNKNKNYINGNRLQFHIEVTHK